MKNVAIYNLLLWYKEYVKKNTHGKSRVAKRIYDFLISVGYAPYTKKAQQLIHDMEEPYR